MSEKITQATLLHKPVRKLYMHYVLPTLIAMASNSLYCLADVFFISKGSGSSGLAALNIAMPLFAFYSAIGLCFGVGGATVMSIAEGQTQKHLRDQAFSASIFGMLAVGLALSIVGSIFIEPFAYALGSSKELLPLVKEYMLPINLGAFLFVLNCAGVVLLRNDHAPKLAMKATLTGNIANIVLDYIFVMVWDMGMFGAAVATSLSAFLMVLCMLPHFLLKRNTVHFVKDFSTSLLWKRILNNGLGSGILEISAGSVILIFNFVILKQADSLFLAAFAIVTNIAYVMRGLLNGFAQAAQPILSTNFGANRKDRVSEVLKISLTCSVAFVSVVYMMFLIFPDYVAAIFANGDTQLIMKASQGIRFYFSGLLFTAIITLILYYLQAIEQGKMATVLAILKGIIYVVIALFSLLYIFGIQGIWFTITVAEAMAVLTGAIFMKKMKS